ncbi:hypothetical protein PORUE0001_0422 [Porphyromonas uenonis 60-3]|uniref:Uncharacterized protein n=1 Tax=Porphyromonas uenonis 60-3 TaxID=596327 RepID=C2MDA1_9PORP|nr:hypothetical protein PORUE0001_0422 [Porphyromonas uenonis 60-3]
MRGRSDGAKSARHQRLSSRSDLLLTAKIPLFAKRITN